MKLLGIFALQSAGIPVPPLKAVLFHEIITVYKSHTAVRSTGRRVQTAILRRAIGIGPGSFCHHNESLSSDRTPVNPPNCWLSGSRRPHRNIRTMCFLPSVSVLIRSLSRCFLSPQCRSLPCLSSNGESNSFASVRPTWVLPSRSLPLPP